MMGAGCACFNVHRHCVYVEAGTPGAPHADRDDPAGLKGAEH